MKGRVIMPKHSCVVVGAGGISNAWFPPLKTEKVEIRGIVDLNVENARSQAEKYELDVELSDDLKATLKKCQPDFVVDLTVPDAHCKVTCTALRSGCHVIGEKPMANSMAEARRMVKASEDSGKLYMVSQSRRWNGIHDVARKMAERNKVGDLTTANCDFYIGAHFGGFRDEMDSPLILDMSIHHFDLVRFITGKDPVAVYCKEFNPKGSWYKGDVAASAIFEMSDGMIFTYRGSWCAEGCHTSWNGDWRFIGTKGTMLMEQDQMPTGEVVTGKTGFHRSLKPLKPLKNTLKHGGMHGALREMLTFLRTGKTPQCECHDNIKSLAMVFAAIESNKKGRRVPVKAL
jgi:predicted dehydrogenase